MYLFELVALGIFFSERYMEVKLNHMVPSIFNCFLEILYSFFLSVLNGFFYFQTLSHYI